jgi:hypothetical protein
VYQLTLSEKYTNSCLRNETKIDVSDEIGDEILNIRAIRLNYTAFNLPVF